MNCKGMIKQKNIRIRGTGIYVFLVLKYLFNPYQVYNNNNTLLKPPVLGSIYEYVYQKDYISWKQKAIALDLELQMDSF